MIKIITNLEAWAHHRDMSLPELYVVTATYQNIKSRKAGTLEHTVIQWCDGSIDKYSD